MLCLSNIFSLKFVETVFVSLSFDLASASIVSARVITESSVILVKYLPFFPPHKATLQILSLLHIWCFLHSHQHLSLFHFWYELNILPSNLHLHSHISCFTFFPVIIWKTSIFKSTVVLPTLTLLDRSLRVIQLPIYLSNLTENG